MQQVRHVQGVPALQSWLTLDHRPASVLVALLGPAGVTAPQALEHLGLLRSCRHGCTAGEGLAEQMQG